MLTAENNADLASSLALTDYCDPSILALANAHHGQMISLPGCFGALAPHAGATTLHDILIGAGDSSETSAPGPAFQFRDVNTTSDLIFVGAAPDTIGVVTTLDVTTAVGTQEGSLCSFLLEPVTTVVR